MFRNQRLTNERAKCVLGASSRLRPCLVAAFIGVLLCAGAAFAQASLEKPIGSKTAGINDVLPSAAEAEPAERVATVLRVGISSFALPAMRDPMETALANAFHRARLAEHIELRGYSVADLEAAVRRGEVDILVSSAGLARRLIDTGARPVATTVRPGLEDPNHNEGSAFVVRADDRRIEKLADLEGLRLSANLPYGFSGYHIAIGEIAAQGFDPEHFFGEARFFSRSAAMADIAEDVAAGRADVGILRLCAYEHLERERPDLARMLRVLPPERPVEGKVACRHSTKLYPAQSISVMPTVSPAVSKALVTAVLTMAPIENGRSWSIATDFKGVDELLESLKIGPYAYLREWTLKRFLAVAWPYVALFLAGVAILFLHSRRADQLVGRRERELSAAYAREAEQRERIALLQRAGAVGQLSSLIAHEIHQPLASIRLFAEGLHRQAVRGAVSPERVAAVGERIAAEAERAGEVVNRVREYARGRLSDGRSVRVDELMLHLDQTYPGLMRRVERVEPKGSALDATIFGSAIELELALVNLIRNAFEAVKSCEKPLVSLAIEAFGETVRFTISDNGPSLSKEAFASLSSPVTSQKPEGLGLGLAITRSIIESHGGTLVFERRDTAGLEAIVTLPRCRDTRAESALKVSREKTDRRQGTSEREA